MCAESKRAFPPGPLGGPAGRALASPPGGLGGGAWAAATLAVSLLVGAGCAKNVAQDADSGKDFRNKGAKTIKLEGGEGRSRKDIVTYPGGDRVDWKVFEVPKGKDGTLKVRLRWSPPRPNLDLSFDVYDQYFHRIARAKPAPGSGRRLKKVTIKDASPGKYYVQVYASGRGDAGTYRVAVEFKEAAEVAVAEATASEIPDPPTLPAIPEAPEVTEAPATQPTTPTPPVVEPVPAAQPVKARVSKYEVSGGGTLMITIDKGKNAGVEAGWKGQVLGGSGQPVRGGDFTVSKVSGSESQGKVGLSVDQIKTNNRVLLTPP
jgi:hypothetical protein